MHSYAFVATPSVNMTPRSAVDARMSTLIVGYSPPATKRLRLPRLPSILTTVANSCPSYNASNSKQSVLQVLITLLTTLLKSKSFYLSTTAQPSSHSLVRIIPYSIRTLFVFDFVTVVVFTFFGSLLTYDTNSSPNYAYGIAICALLSPTVVHHRLCHWFMSPFYTNAHFLVYHRRCPSTFI